jgi:hypothetical protein
MAANNEAVGRFFMKRAPFVLILALAMGLGVSAVRADDATPPPATKPAHKPALRGKISKVDGDKITVTARGGQDTEVTTDSDTKFMLDGQPATLADAKEGLFVSVNPDTGTAKMVRMSTKPPQRKKPADGSGNSTPPPAK